MGEREKEELVRQVYRMLVSEKKREPKVAREWVDLLLLTLQVHGWEVRRIR